MYSLLLVLIYIAFISLGLPDSLLGSAWPIINIDFNVPISYAGIVTMIIAFGTIVSSLLSDRLTRKFKTGFVTFVSVMLTAIALLGFSFSSSFLAICLWAIPYGLGAGAVDAALNNYVALHYNAKHMNWLHCFWGVGAAISPYIMGYALTKGNDWHQGYYIVFVIQIIISVFLFASLPIWKKQNINNNNIERANNDLTEKKPLKLKQVLKIKGVIFVLIAFFSYSAIEQTTGLWASSYLVEHKNIDVKTAASFASMFFLGITFGRFICGFITLKIGDKNLIRIGIAIIIIGIFLIFLPIKDVYVALIGLVIIGLGCAPIYPSIIHSTPTNFGKDNSQAVIGIQMASAYIGTTFMPYFFGILAQFINIKIFPIYLSFYTILLLVMIECLNNKLKLKVRNEYTS